MTNDDRRVDLVVRAKDVEAKPLADLLKLIDRLGKGLDDLAKDGGPATRTVTELTATVKDFATVTRELASRRALVESFLAVRDGAAEADQRVTKAKTALDAYKSSLEGVASRTADQKDQLRALTRVYNAADRQVKGFAARQASAETALAGIGVSAADAARELRRLLTIEQQVDSLSLKAEQNLRGRDAAVRAIKAEAKAAQDLAAEMDRLAKIEASGRAELLQRGADALQGELASLREAEALEKRIAAERAAEDKRREQAAHDRLATLQRIAQAEMRQHGGEALQGELAAIREAEALERRLAAERDAAAKAEAQRQAALKATGDALRTQKEREIAQQREEADALRITGKAAAETVAEVDRLLVAVAKLRDTPAVRTLAQQIAELSRPAKDASVSLEELNATLPDIERRQRQAASAVELSAAEYKQLAQDVRTLDAALGMLNRTTGAIEGFRRQRDELQRVETALTEAQGKLSQYSRQAQQGVGGADVAAGLAEQEKAVASLSQEYQRLGARVAESEQFLRLMGIAVEKLDQSERDLLATAARTRAAFDAQADATSRLGQAAQRGAAQLGSLHNETGAGLALYQRVRGQVLGLAAAYVGLFGVINEGGRTVDAANALQGINARLGVAFGDDPKAVAQEMEYVRSVADRLGLQLQSTAAAYSKFAIAGRSANLTTNETRFIFEKFSEVARVFRLSVEDTEGVFKALEQILSKAKVQSEELRGQLGDRLSGALNQFAKSLGISTAQLDKLLESGKVPAEFLLLFARQFGESVAGQVEPASKAFDASVNRLGTSLFDFRNRVAASGFLDTMTKLAEAVAKFLDSADGQKVATALGGLAALLASPSTELLDVLRGVIQGVESLTDTAGAMGQAVSAAFDATGVSAFAAEMLKAVDAAQALGYALAALGAAGGISLVLTKATSTVAALAGGASVAALALRLLSTVIRGLLWPALIIMTGVDVFRWAERNFSWVGKTSIVLEGLMQKLEAIATFLAKPAGAGGLSKAFDELKKKLQEIDDVQAEGFAKIVAKEEGRAVITRPDASGRSVIHDEALRAASHGAAAGGGRGVVNPQAQGTQLDSSREEALQARIRELMNQPTKEEQSKAKHDLAEAQTLLKQVEGALRDLETAAARRVTNEAEEAARAIDLQYRTLMENIDRVGGVTQQQLDAIRKAAKISVDEAKTPADLERVLRERADQAKATLKQRAADQFAVKKAKEEVSALIDQRDALIELAKVQAKIDPEKRAQAQQAELTILAEYRDRVVAAANAAADLAEKEQKVAEAARLRALAQETQARGSEREVLNARLGDAQNQIQEQIARREAALALLDAKVSLNQVDDVEAQRQRLAIMEQSAAKIREAAESARDLGDQLKNPAVVDNMDALLLKLQQVDERTVKSAESFKTGFADAVVEASDQAADALGRVVTKGGDIGDVFDAVGQSFLKFAVSYLKQIANMIIQTYALATAQQILRATGFAGGVSGGVSGNVVGGGNAAGVGAAVAHTGGVAGLSIAGWRHVSADVFAGAERFHSGGLPGLRPNEVPAILKKGEEVLRTDDPRNILNRSGTAGQQSTAIKAVIVDDQRKALEQMASPEGEQILITHVRKNATTLKQLLKG